MPPPHRPRGKSKTKDNHVLRLLFDTSSVTILNRKRGLVVPMYNRRHLKQHVESKHSTVMHKIDVDRLRRQLRETIFRGRNLASIRPKVDISIDGKDDNICGEVRALPRTTPLGRTLKDFCASNQDITWYVQECVMRAFDKNKSMARSERIAVARRGCCRSFLYRAGVY